jgi:hypothetical protein
MFDNSDPRWSDPRDQDALGELDREIYRDSRERGDDPRDALLTDLDLPRGLERELVLDRDRVYELNGEDSRMLAIHVGVNRPRELNHDAQLYRAHQRAEKQLRDEGAEIRRVVLEQELKRDYQSFLQEHNRDRPDSDGRPDRDPREIAQWAQEHELPHFDDQVHFPDFRIEYDLDGREGHQDVEVLTAHTVAPTPPAGGAPLSSASARGRADVAVGGSIRGWRRISCERPVDAEGVFRQRPAGPRRRSSWVRLHRAPGTVPGHCDGALRRVPRTPVLHLRWHLPRPEEPLADARNGFSEAGMR